MKEELKHVFDKQPTAEEQKEIDRLREEEALEHKKLCFAQDYYRDKKKTLSELAAEIAKAWHIKTIIETEPRLQTYYYNAGVYIEGANGVIKQQARAIGEEHITNSDLMEIVGKVQTTTYISEAQFQEQPNRISVADGILDLNTKTLTPHTPDFLTRTQIPIEYDQVAECPRWKQFLEEVIVPRNTEKTSEHEAKIKTLQELAGYCLYRELPIHKTFMLTGEGANGKSVFLSLITELLGENNVSHISLQSLAYNRFAASGLVSKLANIHADLSDKALKETGIFKMATGDDPLWLEKKFCEGRSGRVHAKHIFSANRVPATSDPTQAFFRRWVIINFPNSFIDNPDKQLKKKLRQELSGILNWAVEGLERLMQNDCFSYEPSVEDTELQYLILSDPAAAFAETKLEQSSEAWLTKEEMYAEFISYVKEKRMPILSENAFAKKLKEALPNIRTEKKSLDEGRKNVWVGYQLIGFVQGVKDVNVKSLFCCSRVVDKEEEKSIDMLDTNDTISSSYQNENLDIEESDL